MKQLEPGFIAENNSGKQRRFWIGLDEITLETDVLYIKFSRELNTADMFLFHLTTDLSNFIIHE